ncbi:hypothetical protein, partial [Pseudomonas viridiflava]|uniref:hypothetical protein n=2 Tax=Pseudomonas viridiflava TaxID=33069 RepID=UPI0019D2AE25
NDSADRRGCAIGSANLHAGWGRPHQVSDVALSRNKPPPTVRCLLRDSATSKTLWRHPQGYFFSSRRLQMCDPVLKA